MCAESRARLSVRELRERLTLRRVGHTGFVEKSELVGALEGAPHETLCSICHDDFCDGDAVRLLPCNHYHHVACVDKWLLDASRAPACPLCNTKLEYYCKVD